MARILTTEQHHKWLKGAVDNVIYAKGLSRTPGAADVGLVIADGWKDRFKAQTSSDLRTGIIWLLTHVFGFAIDKQLMDRVPRDDVDFLKPVVEEPLAYDPGF